MNKKSIESSVFKIVENITKDTDYEIFAKAVILATGGFSSNKEMIAEFEKEERLTTEEDRLPF